MLHSAVKAERAGCLVYARPTVTGRAGKNLGLKKSF